MASAMWRGVVIAHGEDVVVVEGNVYFAPTALRHEHLRPSATKTTCGWKGVASYYDVVVGDEVNADAAWTYPSPKAAASQIAGYVAFWRGVEVRS